MRLFSRHQSEAPQRRQAFPAQSSHAKTPESRQDMTFRRGRTLTGSASPLIYSTNETKADLKSPRVHAHMLARKRRHLGGLFLLAFAACIALFVLMSQFTARVQVQASPDASMQLDDRYEKIITTYLSDHPAERWRFFMNIPQLTAYIESVAPEIKSVTTHGSSGFGSSLFSVTPRTPVASWNINGQELYVDESGAPFSRNYFQSPPLTVTDHSGIPISPGQNVASNHFMGFVGQVVGLAKEKGYAVTDIEIPPSMTRQVNIRLKGVAYPIKFSSDRSAGEEVEDMAHTISWMSARKLSPKYIDVRIKGRAFYR